jgi:predicted ATPase
MEGKRTLRKIRLENFLSFGREGEEIELQPLNVLIGPNASGKSNFIEAFRFLQALPGGDSARPLREGGGVGEYLWKGSSVSPTASLAVVLEGAEKDSLLSYQIGITETGQKLQLVEERIGFEAEADAAEQRPFIYRYPDERNQGVYNVRTKSVPEGYVSEERTIDANRSIVGWLRDPVRYPELARLQAVFTNIQFAGEWNLSRVSPVRAPQQTDLPTDVLLEGASNLGLILNNYSSRTRQAIADRLKQVYGGVEEIRTRVQGNTVQVFLHEQGFERPTPATRLSDGTLRYLCLLTLLNQPEMPPLLCLEEPEVGLHPDVIRPVAELLIEAARRTQLIVTTHSESLVSALAEVPETVIVCERDRAGSRLKRLDPERLKKWLEKYSLGELWMMGEIGGTRW